MDVREGNQTAVGSALLRATHPFCDDEPDLIHDPYALALSGWPSIDDALLGFLELERKLTAHLSAAGAARFVRELRAVTVMRARLAEDLLCRATMRDIHQCVVLGAGLDSMAYRNDPRWAGCMFFEVDRPATQEWKRARLAALGIPQPLNVAFVPCDLHDEHLLVSLAAQGFRAYEPAFVIWLGVTPYLSSSAIFATLRNLSNWAPRSEILFDYIIPEAWLDDFGRAAIRALRAEMAALGEPGQCEVSPLEMEARIAEMGFHGVHRFDERQLNQTYFSGRRDGLVLPDPCSARWVWLRRSHIREVG